MKPRLVRIIFIILAALAFTTKVAGQPAAPALLAAGQVRALASSVEPADQARLRAHFEALAARYDADARQHRALARGVAGNPNRWSGGGPGEYHRRLAEAAQASADVTRKLAAHHGRLSAWLPSAFPLNGDAFEDGAGAPAIPPKRELLRLEARAQSPQEHGIVVEYYLMLSDAYDAAANTHSQMARAYRVTANRRTPGADPAIHCDRQVHAFHVAAREAARHASDHREMVGTF